MAVKLRLTRMGKKKQPFYRIVAIDGRKARDGEYIEQIGYYTPMTNPATVKIESDIAVKWLRNGAQPTETVKALLKKANVYDALNAADTEDKGE